MDCCVPVHGTMLGSTLRETVRVLRLMTAFRQTFRPTRVKKFLEGYVAQEHCFVGLWAT